MDGSNQPYSLIENGEHWSLDASHECLEMLVDPAGNRTQVGPLLKQAVLPGHTTTQVQYVVEVCDPIQDAQYAYEIDGILVSDFFTPNFYDTVGAPGVRYDFTGALSAPLQVLTNGYVSWIDPTTGNTMQFRNFLDAGGHPAPEILNLTASAQFGQTLGREALRPAIDRVTWPPDLRASLTQDQRSALTLRRNEVKKAAAARSARHERDISDAYRQT